MYPIDQIQVSVSNTGRSTKWHNSYRGYHTVKFIYVTTKYNLAKKMEKTYKLFFEVLFNSKTQEATQIS